MPGSRRRLVAWLLVAGLAASALAQEATAVVHVARLRRAAVRRGRNVASGLRSADDGRRVAMTLGPSPAMALVTTLCLSLLAGAGAQGLLEAPERLPWSRVGEWTFENVDYEGDAFDVEAWADFHHAESGEVLTVPMFFAGSDRWAVRFAGVRTGRWTFETRSDDPELDGRRGDVAVTPGPTGASGFLRVVGDKLATRVQDGRAWRGVPYHVYMASTEVFDHVGMLPRDPRARDERIEALLDEAEAYGMPALLAGVYNNWFSYGSLAYDGHDSRVPDLETFAALDALILAAHERGMYVHLWAWGDERRRWTPVGLGGIGGPADRRLQRYVAARLGPLPGWSMSYGFDLEEWVTPEQVRAWSDALHGASPFPMVLTARELGASDGVTFELGDDRLDIVSTDDRPREDFYALARERLDESGLPVLFERRFLFGRDGVWDATTTRRAMWEFTMAGGAGAIWGPPFESLEGYPSPTQLAIHGRFWRDRFDVSLQPVDNLAEAFAARTADGSRYVVYAEDADRLPLLSFPDGTPPSAVAVDVAADAYAEIAVDTMGMGDAWQAPYRSDWALAVGYVAP